MKLNEYVSSSFILGLEWLFNIRFEQKSNQRAIESKYQSDCTAKIGTKFFELLDPQKLRFTNFLSKE
jgi:hypothetical protein